MREPGRPHHRIRTRRVLYLSAVEWKALDDLAKLASKSKSAVAGVLFEAYHRRRMAQIGEMQLLRAKAQF